MKLYRQNKNFHGNMRSSQNNNALYISNENITRTDDMMVFLNGMLLYEGIDWTIEDYRYIRINQSLNLAGSLLYIIKHIPQNNNGYLENKYHEYLTSQKIIFNINNINSNSNLLVFVNGLLVDPSEYTIEENKIEFNNFLNINDWIIVTEVFIGNKEPFNVLYYYNTYAVDSSTINVYGLSLSKTYLVFYNGLLYLEKKDYFLTANMMSFYNLILNQNYRLTIIGV